MNNHFDNENALPPLRMTIVEDLLSGELMIPATAVTTLLRTIAASWTDCPCADRGDQAAAVTFATALTGYADQLDAECIATITPAGSPPGGPAPTGR